MTDDREPLGRLVRETWVAWALEQPDPNPSWLVPWDELGTGDREVDMRIGSAVAARAVADAGTEVAAARTDRDRIRLERGALASHLPAIRDALSAAVADARYEAQAKPYRAALMALEAGRQEPLSAVCTGPDCGEQFADSETSEYLFATRERMERLLYADGWASGPVLCPACQEEAAGQIGLIP
jgi:hypothetical protein